jgi:hypothetical protein
LIGRARRRLPNDQRYLAHRRQLVSGNVNDTPEGAPGGLMYAALPPHITLANFEALMRLLVETKRITKRGDRYFSAGA